MAGVKCGEDADARHEKSAYEISLIRPLHHVPPETCSTTPLARLALRRLPAFKHQAAGLAA
ncbi:hypothetical protein AZF01_14635 [Martelella sp. AD-3]|nr:hypothetical protein AZF01_14635 [Martelella sp. AD-3]